MPWRARAAHLDLTKGSLLDPLCGAHRTSPINRANRKRAISIRNQISTEPSSINPNRIRPIFQIPISPITGQAHLTSPKATDLRSTPISSLAQAPFLIQPFSAQDRNNHQRAPKAARRKTSAPTVLSRTAFNKTALTNTLAHSFIVAMNRIRAPLTA